MLNRYLLILRAWLLLFVSLHACLALANTNDGAILSLDSRIWDHRQQLISGIENNIHYLSRRGDENWPSTNGLSRREVLVTLKKFKELLSSARSFEELQNGVRAQFELRPASGIDGKGTVKFTGYFQPTYRASRSRGGPYQYPIYRLPEDFKSWSRPHPARVVLEGYEGKGSARSVLKGKELAWLSNRWEAFMIHVQGSALLQMEDGSIMSVGFAGGTDYPFRGVPKSYLQQKKVAWSRLGEHFSSYPWELNALLSRNNRFIFFKENEHTQPLGSIGVPVIAERSIATDKEAMPPGALSLVFTKLPEVDKRGTVRLKTQALLVLDQDSGSAIKGPGRVDIFMGSGPQAQVKANHVFSHGELYFLVADNRPHIS